MKRIGLSNIRITVFLIFLLVLAILSFFSVSAESSEPSIQTILTDLGFTTVTSTPIQTFSPGIYKITLLAEFAWYYDQNVISYYAVETTNYKTIFNGSEGTSSNSEYVIPLFSKTFTSNNQFGLSLLTPDQRYFTQHELNPDTPEKHTKIYVNLTNPNLFLIFFEDCFGEKNDRDYNDLVISLEFISSLKINNITRTPENPNYNQRVKVSAQISNATCNIDKVFLSYQINHGSWVTLTMFLEKSEYIAEIPSQPYDNLVNYRVSVSDIIGNSEVSEVFSYTIGDFVPPKILKIIQVPKFPKPNESIKIWVILNEPPYASGVRNVTIWYNNDIDWVFIIMKLENGIWTATIPGQPEGVTVIFFVETFDNSGNSAKTAYISYTAIISNFLPVVEFVSSPSSVVYTSELVEFDASASYDPDGLIVGYVWDFGDGSNATGAIVSHLYTDDGNYLVTLTVIDDDGMENVKTRIQRINNKPPVAKLIESGTFVNRKENITFDASSSYDSDGIIAYYVWDFGDGTRANGKTVSHSYDTIGFFTLTLTVTDNDGASDKICVAQIVMNNLPIALLSNVSETAIVGENIFFDASASYDPDGLIVGYVWDFGDGTTGKGMTINHEYGEEGTFIVTLKVTDDDGCTENISSTIKITKKDSNQNPIASFVKSVETAIVGENIFFDASASYDPDGLIVGYVWDFGDGTTGKGMTTNHEYGEEGTFIVTLKVTDDDGNFKSFVDEINVESELTISLAIISVIGLGITTLTTTLLYGLFELKMKKN